MPDDLERALRTVAEVLQHRDAGDLEEELLETTANRLRKFMERVRALDEAQLLGEVPSFSFLPAHPAMNRDPVLQEQVFARWGGPAGTHVGGSLPAEGSSRDGSGPAVAPAKKVVPDPKDEPAFQTAAGLAAMVRKREISAEELVERALQRAETLGPPLNAFVSIQRESARARAREIDRRIAAGEAVGPLAGVPVALKDLFYTSDAETSAGASWFAEFAPKVDGPAVTRLREAGAVLIGKTNTHQFAYGPTTEISDFGPSRNPHHLDHSPGGSSGGSAAAVAAGIVPLAMGTDTAGSVRIPAAACGIFGIKPTYGRISTRGIVPLSWSQDHPGPLTRSVEDAAWALAVLAGPDPEDPGAAPVPVGDYVGAARRGREQGVRGLRVGLLASWVEDRVDEGVRASVRQAAALLEDGGAQVQEVEFLAAGVAMLINRLLTLAEAASFHAPLLARKAHRYAGDIRARLEMGQFLPARDYLLAQRLRGEVCRRLNRLFRDVDLLLLPTLAVGAPRLGTAHIEWPEGPETISDATIRLTAPFNVTGHPAAAVPLGRAGNGMPASIQLVGRCFDEETVLQAAAWIESARAPQTASNP